MTTCGEALAELTVQLRSGGIASARLDARILLAHCLGVGVTTVFSHPERLLDEADLKTLGAVTTRRLRREPVSRILGRREFWSLGFAITADTLDPRPDTETVVEAVLDCTPDRRSPLRVLDLGAGSGCILLALLSELPAATGIGVDHSPGAVAAAIDNALALGLAERARFIVGDWGKGIDSQFDVIVTNPPYIPDLEIDHLDAEVAVYDPRAALAGGADGLACYRRLAPDLAGLLKPGGVVAVEVGQGQAQAVRQILEAAGLVGIGLRRDLAGTDRCALFSLPTPPQM